MPPTTNEVPATTIFIRHADVAASAPHDPPGPPLNAAGATRAHRLRHILADAGITVILVSPFQRTLQTAAPLAADLGLVPQAMDAPSAVTAILAAPTSAVVLVIGHTTTLPVIAAGLGEPALPAIATTEFDHLFIHAGGRLTHLHYGARPG